MKKLVLAAALMFGAALFVAPAGFAAEEKERADVHGWYGNAVCYAYDIYGRQYYWVHPNPHVAANAVMNACFHASGYACHPGICTW